MADTPEVMKEECPTLRVFERNRPFYGQLISVRTKELEYRYFNDKRHLLNRLIHGVGLVRGLQVSNVDVVGTTLKIDLERGVALDCWGREIVVDEPEKGYQVVGEFDGKALCLYIQRKCCPKDPEPALTSGSACGESCCYSRIREGFEVVLGGKPLPHEAALSGVADVEDNPVVKEHLEKNPQCTCEEPRVLIAVLKQKSGGGYELDKQQINEHRAIVYSNPMLYDLICGHMADTGNPHDGMLGITAANKDVKHRDGFIKLTPANGVEITEGKEQNEIRIACTTAQPGTLKSVNQQPGDEQGNVKIVGQNTIRVTEAGNQITITEDHSANAVNLGSTADPRNKHVSDEDASRWDCAIRTINTIAPTHGDFTISPGTNITITEEGAGKITIASPLVPVTGFADIYIRDETLKGKSKPIDPGFRHATYCVYLGTEQSGDHIDPLTRKDVQYGIGPNTGAGPVLTALTATVQKSGVNMNNFVIDVAAADGGGGYLVRIQWWAIPGISAASRPTLVPTHVPTVLPTHVPTVAPTGGPTLVPTFRPTILPTLIPTVIPTFGPPVFNPADFPGRRVDEVTGIGGALARRLEEAGIRNLAELASADAGRIVEVLNVSDVRATAFIDEARRLLTE